MTKHISEVRVKTARHLAAADLDKDLYHKAIQLAAQYMVSQGYYSWRYSGQTSELTTIWLGDGAAMTVRYRGNDNG